MHGINRLNSARPAYGIDFIDDKRLEVAQLTCEYRSFRDEKKRAEGYAARAAAQGLVDPVAQSRLTKVTTRLVDNIASRQRLAETLLAHGAVASALGACAALLRDDLGQQRRRAITELALTCALTGEDAKMAMQYAESLVEHGNDLQAVYEGAIQRLPKHGSAVAVALAKNLRDACKKDDAQSSR